MRLDRKAQYLKSNDYYKNSMCILRIGKEKD